MVRGQYIEYDIATENYLVTDAPGRSSKAPAESRVHVTIQPRNNRPGGASGPR
jgi:hypothetical protein